MAEPALSAAAGHVRRYDPALFRTALFAPEPGRERLMTLYAFDIELSRALSRASEPMIALMRLQWWRDVVAEARAGGAPRAHDVAGPLHALLGAMPLEVEPLIEARALELEGVPDRAGFDGWAEARFGSLVGLAAEVLGSDASAVAAPAGRALGMAFAFRTAARMAAEGRHLLPLAPEERADPPPATLKRLARQGVSALMEARDMRGRSSRRALPALLPLADAEAALRSVARTGAWPPEEPRPRPLVLLARAITGRW